MRVIPSRHTDPETSHMGAEDVKMRANSHKHKLLKAYERSGMALTADQARERAGLSERSCYWKRCSELRDEGLIESVMANGHPAKKFASSGSWQMVSVITDRGRAKLIELGRP